jgi:hypothetical protein
MSDFPPDEASEELWGAPDFEGRTHAQPCLIGSRVRRACCRLVATGANPSDSSTRSWSSRPLGSIGR